MGEFQETCTSHASSIKFVRDYAAVFIDTFNAANEEDASYDLLFNSKDDAKYMLGRATKRTMDVLSKSSFQMPTPDDPSGPAPRRNAAATCMLKEKGGRQGEAEHDDPTDSASLSGPECPSSTSV